MQRKDEIRTLLELPPRKIIEKAGPHLVVCESLDMLHAKFALDIATAIKKNNEKGLNSRFILPVGPTGQYPYLVDIINTEEIDLSNCFFFFMDEYCDADGKAIDIAHPLSFRDIAQQLFLQELDASCGLTPDRIFFPTEATITKLDDMIKNVGGIDVCFGGIGIHGHIAFNEPESGVKHLGSRLVDLNEYTVTINAVRASVGGNLEGFPRRAFTIGMKQILDAKRIMLYCRNGTSFDWANTILRLALFGKPGDDYPVTHIRNKDYIITTDLDTLRCPINLL